MSNASEDIDMLRSYLDEVQHGLPPKEWTGLKYFSEVEHTSELKKLAQGMSLREILDYYAIGSFDTLPDRDKFFFAVNYLKGRASGTAHSVNKLFESMSGINGAKSSVEYLRRFGANWQGSIGGELPKEIKIVIDD